METYKEKKPITRKHYKAAVFVAFLGIITLIILTSFDGTTTTGNTVKENFQEQKPINLNAELMPLPDIELKGDFELISIQGNSNSSFYVRDQKFSFAEYSDNYITIKKFEGDLNFNKDQITELNGRANSVIINGVELTSKDTRKIRVYFEEPVQYKYIETINAPEIKEINSISSGRISLDNEKRIFNLNQEKTIIQGFKGNIKVNEKLKLNGNFDSLEISGDTNILVKN